MNDPRGSQPEPEGDDLFSLVSQEDIGSASRSCAAIIFVLLFMILLAIVFVVVQTVR